MSNLIGFGNLGKSYQNNAASTLKTNATKTVEQKDREAKRKASEAKRKAREERMSQRDQKNGTPEKQLKEFKKDPTKDINIQEINNRVLGKTNALAREYGLPEPDNEEALKHDRLHCMTCDRKLDDPNAYKGDGLIDDADIRLMCCWCFGKMGDADIKSTMKTDKEATAAVRLAIYNPLESTKAEIENMTKDRIIYLKAKIKKHNAVTCLVGNIKHDYLQEGDDFENTYRNMAKTRYTSCTL